MIDDVESVYNRAIETIETAVIAPHPDSTSCFASRLRPSEEAALIINCYLNPPPPWGIKLNCSSMFWGSEKCVNIAQKLILNHTVTSLDLSMCDLQENEAVVFFSCLRRNTCLKHLCMNGNCIGDKGAVAAAQCVGNLETLHMSCNGICDNGAVALASSLRQSEKIKTLNLRGNRISLYGAYMLVSALEAVLDLFSQNIRSSILAFDFVLCSSSELNSEKLTKEREQMSMDKSDSKDCYVSVRANKEKLNESLHTLWLRHNDGIPEELFKVLDKVLSKRFPQPPKVFVFNIIMFHKKYSVKDVTTVSAKEAKALREKVLSSVGKEQLSFAESIWKKGEPISRSIWQLSSGGSASIYFLKKIPLAFSTLCLPNDAKESLCISSDLVFPTLFFILMMRDANNGKDIDFTSIFRNNVFCRGPTSQFIVSGAHLMIPGIVNVSTLDQENILKGDAVYIYSTGNRIPFAIGLATEELSRNAERGRGVYILHSYKDNLWEEYFKPFVSACACPKSILPDTFQEASVNDCLSSPTPRMTMLEEIHFANDSTLSVPPEEQNSIFLEKVVKSAFDTLSNEEKLLDFALCETLRNFKTSSLPIPVGEFIPLLLGNFPRFPDIEMRIDFKKTKYKKALSYLSTRDDTLKISMEGKGCYFVVEVMKSSDLYRNHRHEYADFLRFIQDPMKDQEVIESKRLLNCGVGKGILKSRIKSMESLYAPKTKCMLDLQRVVCTGLFPATDNISGSLMSEENDSGGQQVAYNVGNDFLGDVYSRKYLCNNLRKYISSKNLLRFNSGKNSPPDVQVDTLLSVLVKESTEQICITNLEELLIQKAFLPVHEITLETCQISNNVPSSNLVVSRLVKKGTLPKVSIHTEKRAGNKKVTVVKHLDAYGFELESIATLWKQQFSTFCTVFDPSKEMQKIKNGTKVVMEVHLGGEWLSKLKNVLETDLGFPQHIISVDVQ